MADKTKNKNKQTWGILLNVIIFGFEGIVYLLAAAFLLAFGIATIVSLIFPVGVFLTGFTLIMILLGVAYLWICRGLLRHDKYAWYVSIILLFISFILDVVFPITAGNYMVFIVLIVIVIRVCGLFTSETLKLFKIKI